MKKSIYLIAAFVMAASSCMSTKDNPFFQEWDTPYGIPPFEQIKTEHYIPAVKAGIAQGKASVQAVIDSKEAPSFDNVIVPFEFGSPILDKVQGVLFNLSESLNSPEMEKVVDEALPLLSEYGDWCTMNADLYAKVKAVYDAPQSDLTREQQMVLKKTYEAFVNNGIGLDKEQQERLKKVNSRLAVLQQKFGNNLLAENNAYAASCGSPVSEYYSLMASTEDRSLREKMFKAYSMRGNNGGEFDNNAILLEILQLKAEKAAMLGYENPAAWILHDKMAGNPQAVTEFLDGIMASAVRKASSDLAQMKVLFREDLAERKVVGEPSFKPWDWMYYEQKLKERKYSLNEDEIKPYFQMEKVREGVFSAAGKLYGISFEKIDDCPKYHPEVEGFKVVDADGSLVGVLLTDYYPRSSKRGGAWMSEFRGQMVVDGQDIRPIIVNVGNFNKPGEDGTPALLSIDDVETMFHEFGHALHGLLSKCTYPSVACTSVARDFVELPSQINENWAFQPELLKEYARHYQTGEVIPQALVDKILATRTFGQGFKTTELCAASILDIKWHMMSSYPDGLDIQATEAQFCKEMGLVDEIIPRYRTTYFNHIFNSGYSAGYYSYLWAEVLDKDAFQAFVQEGIFNRETGMRLRNCILSRGGSEEPMTLYREFRGADPDPKYLLRARGLD